MTAVRVAAGGAGTRPWHLPAVERALVGKSLDDAALREASALAAEGARAAGQNGFKEALLQRAVWRALAIAAV